MKPAPFSYYRATSVEDAITALSSADGMAAVLAGGQSLVPMLNLRLSPVDYLIDLRPIAALSRQQETPEAICYGALTTHAAFEDGVVPDGTNGLMRYVASRIAYRAVRNRGTLGGALALADPAADWLTTAVALDATVTLTGPDGQRRHAQDGRCQKRIADGALPPSAEAPTPRALGMRSNHGAMRATRLSVHRRDVHG